MLLKTLLSLAFLASSTLAVNIAEVQGISFVDTVTKQRLQIVGIDYQPGGEAGYDPTTGLDVLSNGTDCLRDAVLMQQLGINTIRVYNVNPATNHDLCMSIFNAAGIYVILDVNSPFMSLDRTAPWTSYYAGYLEYIFSNMENFMHYPNTLAFFASNEVINSDNTTQYNPQYMRAVIRDMRQYINGHSPRHIPVGYSAADVRDVLSDTYEYLACESSDVNSTAEIFGLNSYSWCGTDATFESSGYNTLVEIFSKATMPVFFSEYGCNQPPGQPRPFNEVQALYGPDMVNVFNGGLVYEYSEEANDYGLVTINPDGSAKLGVDYDNLQGQLNKLDLKLLVDIPPSTNTVSQCSKSLMTSDNFDSNWTLPLQPPNSSQLFANGVSNPLKGEIVDIGSTTVAVDVFASDGRKLNPLQLGVKSSSNLPSANSTSSASGSSSTPNNAPSVSAVGNAVVLIAGLAVAMVALA